MKSSKLGWSCPSPGCMNSAPIPDRALEGSRTDWNDQIVIEQFVCYLFPVDSENQLDLAKGID